MTFSSGENLSGNDLPFTASSWLGVSEERELRRKKGWALLPPPVSSKHFT